MGALLLFTLRCRSHGILFQLAPGAGPRRRVPILNSGLKDAGRGVLREPAPRNRVRSLLVIGEVTLVFVALAGSPPDSC